MSLNRVPSMESWERGRGESSSSSRKMSFNPLGDWVPPPQDKDREPIGAFEVSKAQRLREYYDPNHCSLWPI